MTNYARDNNNEDLKPFIFILEHLCDNACKIIIYHRTLTLLRLKYFHKIADKYPEYKEKCIIIRGTMLNQVQHYLVAETYLVNAWRQCVNQQTPFHLLPDMIVHLATQNEIVRIFGVHHLNRLSRNALQIERLVVNDQPDIIP